ncbi:DgyrCDS13661 [Dimorphilus gyrociliatus]|uniref:DgyrCDS13661 n=1 Tax=Dimorphilus gyrociliatus TaxID=2664684 RepID=A0A7I8WBD2_9ANNE|nr:DgyrCDS13661 [Dimorphilus gyrociliatus]
MSSFNTKHRYGNSPKVLTNVDFQIEIIEVSSEDEMGNVVCKEEELEEEGLEEDCIVISSDEEVEDISRENEANTSLMEAESFNGIDSNQIFVYNESDGTVEYSGIGETLEYAESSDEELNPPLNRVDEVKLNDLNKGVDLSDEDNTNQP